MEDKAREKWNPDPVVELWRKQAQQRAAALALRKRQSFLLFQVFKAQPGQKDKPQWIAL